MNYDVKKVGKLSIAKSNELKSQVTSGFRTILRHKQTFSWLAAAFWNICSLFQQPFQSSNLERDK